MEYFFQISLTLLLVYMGYRLWNYNKNSKPARKGTKDEWMTVALLGAAVVGFVVLLILVAKG